MNNKHGGARANAGRKPVSDKKVTVTIYPRQSRIDKIGIDRIKEMAMSAIEEEFEKNNKKT